MRCKQAGKESGLRSKRSAVTGRCNPSTQSWMQQDISHSKNHLGIPTSRLKWPDRKFAKVCLTTKNLRMAPSIATRTVRRVKGLRLRQAKVAGQREGPEEVLPEVWRIVMMLADLSSLAGEMRTWLTVSAAGVRGRASAHRLIASNFPKQNDPRPISINERSENQRRRNPTPRLRVDHA